MKYLLSRNVTTNIFLGRGSLGSRGRLLFPVPQAVHELALLREERARERERVTDERGRWQQEKESVLRYQRQLQLACTHAQRTNRRLHHQIQTLTVSQALAPPDTDAHGESGACITRCRSSR